MDPNIIQISSDYPSIPPTPTSYQYAPPLGVGYIPPPIIDPKSIDYVIVYPNQLQSAIRLKRLSEIDGELNDGFLLYKCWLWVCLIISVITLASNIAALAISESANEVSNSIIPDIVGNSINFIGYFIGLDSIRAKSLIKNNVFKGFLIVLISFDLLMVILIFTIGHTPKRNEGIIALIFIIVSLCLTFLINLWLLSTTDKIGKLLQERSNLINN